MTEAKEGHRPLLIGVAGGTASGKTSICDLIARSLGVRCSVISTDSFYKGLTEEQIKNVVDYNFDHPSAIDFDLILEIMQDLMAGKTVEVPVYDFKTHSRLEETETVHSNDAILFEGIFGLYDNRLRDLMDIKIFVNTDDDTRLGRRLIRDVNERGRQVEGILTQYNRFVKPSYDEFIKPTMQYSDIIVPRGRDNKVALEFITTNLKLKMSKISGTPLSTKEASFEKDDESRIRMPIANSILPRVRVMNDPSPNESLELFNVIAGIEKTDLVKRLMAPYYNIVFEDLMNVLPIPLEDAVFLTSTCVNEKTIDEGDLVIFCPFLMSSPDLIHMSNLLEKYGLKESGVSVISVFVASGFATEILTKYPKMQLVYAFCLADDDNRVPPTPEKELQMNVAFKNYVSSRNLAIHEL